MRPICGAMVLALAAAGFAGADEGGVYVAKKCCVHSIELAPGGACFYDGHGFSRGTWVREGARVACALKEPSEETLEFTVDGDALVDGEGMRWVRKEQWPGSRFPWDRSSDLTIAVADEATGEPIPEFQYTWSMENSEARFDPPLARPIAVASEKGEFVLKAPSSCDVNLSITGRHLVGGYGSYHELKLTSDNTQRRLVVKVKKGVSVRGVVTEKAGGKPVAGARVAPMIFTPPLTSPDSDHAAVTDEHGRFTVHGADPTWGLSAFHPDFLDSGCAIEGAPEKEGAYEVSIEFEAGETLSGVVKDPQGNPIEGVDVSDGAGKQCRTTREGAFTLKSPKKWNDMGKTYYLDFKKDGYAGLTLNPAEADPKGFAVVLEPCLTVEGRVLDGDGKPVTEFTIASGLGVEPEEWSCSSKSFKDPEGRYRLQLPGYKDYSESGKVWIGVKAPGFALWDTVVEVWKGTKPLEIRLSPGVAARAVASLPRGCAAATARLVPAPGERDRWGRFEHSVRMEMGTIESRVESGPLGFEHVRPGPYTLLVYGEGATPLQRAVVVADGGLELGTLTLRGTGTVAGRAFKPKDWGGGPWAFAAGDVVFFSPEAGLSDRDLPVGLRAIPFKADENGNFRVTGVPAGRVHVSIPWNATADIVSSHGRDIIVAEGRQTEVRFFDPDGAWDVTLRVKIGDGSPEQYASGTGGGAKRPVGNVTTREPAFSVELAPKEDGPGSWCAQDFEELREGRILLPDVSPGTYRLRMFEWMGSRGFTEGLVSEAEIEVGPDRRTFDVSLGGGSVGGKVRWTTDNSRMIQVIAMETTTRALRLARADDKGNFCARFLPDGRYVLYAHDGTAGWCRMGEATVKGGSVDVGEHELRAGGSIEAAVELPPGTTLPVMLRVTDAQGIRVEALDPLWKSQGACAVRSLWPGEWTVELVAAEGVVAKATVKIAEKETAQCELKPGKR